MTITSACVTLNSVCGPTVDKVFSTKGRVRVNDVDGYRVWWMNPIASANPRMLFKDCDGTLETADGIDPVVMLMNTVPESGVYAGDLEHRFAKIADPKDASKKCFLMVRKQDGGDLRTEISFPSSQGVPRGSTAWVGFGINIHSHMLNAAPGDETLLFQIQATPDGGDTQMNPPLALVLNGSSLKIILRYNANLVTAPAQTVSSTIWEQPTVGDTWQFFVVKIRSHWDLTKAPFLEISRSINGTVERLVSTGLPNTFNNVSLDYVKSGIYYYADTWTNAVQHRTVYHKGIYLWSDAEGLSVKSIFDFMSEI